MPFSEKLYKVLEEFITVVHAETGFPVVLYDERGIAVSATDREHIGSQHAEARKILSGETDEYVASARETGENDPAREEYNLPIHFKGERIGVFGIAGELKRVRPVARMAAEMLRSRLQEIQYREELALTEERFRNIFSNLQDVYFETTMDGTVISSSPSGSAFSGYPLEEIIGNKVDMLYNDPADLKLLMKELKTRGQVLDLEMLFKRKDGSTYDVSINMDVITDGNGSPKGLRGTIRDITDRKNAERNLRASEEKFRLIFEHAPLGIIHFDKNGVITACNNPFVRIIGSSKDLLVGLDMSKLPDKRIVKKLARALNGSVSFFEGEYHSTTADKITSIRLVFSPVFDKDGIPDGGIGIVEDITERLEAKDKLIASERRFRELAEILPETIYELDLHGKMTFVSQKAFQMFGYSQADFEKGVTVFDMLSKPDQIRIRDKMQIMLNGDESDINEYEVRRKDGTVFPALFQSCVIYEDGKPRGFRGVLIDITEKKRTQELLIQSEKMMSIGGLAAGMAHEINNPLAGIIQNAQVAMNRLTKDIRQNKDAAQTAGTSMDGIRTYMEKRGILEQLRQIDSAGRRAAEIVNNMLSFARKGTTEKSMRDLAHIVENALNLMENDYNLKKSYDFKKVTVLKAFEPDLPMVKCNESKIQQVIINLIKNSIDAAVEIGTPPASLVLQIRLKKRAAHLILEIEDNGPGIQDDIRKRIFEPFFTTKSVDKGTGLGLSISYFIITDDHAGEIKLESATDGGAKFIISLPV